MVTSKRPNIKDVAERLETQQQQIDELQNELTRTRILAQITQRDLQPLRSDRNRIMQVVRPILPIARAIRSIIRRAIPSLKLALISCSG